MRRLTEVVLILSFSVLGLGSPPADGAEAGAKLFRAGAYAADVTPRHLPVIINGGMTERMADTVHDPLHARCLVLDDGTEPIAIAVVDSCMIPRDVLDEAKRLAHNQTGIAVERMLISATHTHSAPAAGGCLGSDRDERYAAFLPGAIARGIAEAQKNLRPARIGWGVGHDPENVFCRRFLMKPGTAPTNPFSGKQDDQAQMNPGFNNPNIIRRTGPVDTAVSVVSIQSLDGKPLALLGNYSTHYVGSAAVSADYFAVFCEKIAEKLGVEAAADGSAPPFMAMLSNGTSGDANCNDFLNPPRKYDKYTVAESVASVAHQVCRNIQYYDWAPIEMEEKLLTLDVRMPTEEEVARAKEVVEALGGGKPKTVVQVYARETVLLSQLPPTRELKLQAVRIGDLAIAAIPNEVFGSTGLTLKAKSPVKTTINISLANGCEGYIPPPDQHKLGGYTTWRARTSLLEEEAEPKIVATLLAALEEIASRRRDEKPVPSQTDAGKSPRETDSAAASDEPPLVPSPVSPEESLRWLYPREGFRAELVASEPVVVDPVAFDWDATGRLWVVEMHDYPLGVDGKGQPGGRVKILQDTTGDGRYDRATLFAENLPFPNGILVWRDGALVTSAPRIVYLADTTGDGKADQQHVLFSGFHETNQQLRINGLRWGLDNWIYCANGGAGGLRGWDGRVKSEKTGEVVDLGGRDFRIRPDDGLLDPQLGKSQFGRNRDDWGNWFGVSNANPLWHFVIGDHYLRRNPHFAPPDCRVDVSITPRQSRVFARSRPGRFFHESQVGLFTSANSAIIYRDELLGEGFAGNSFVSEPVHNLVHREVVEPKGVTFASRRAADELQTEFLASADTWFRPTMLRTGPDGALWIADMYREIIEHPEWIPQERRGGFSFRGGDDRGRIYRVYSEKFPPRPVPRLAELSFEDMAGLLESPNGTLRDLVQRLIVVHRLEGAVPHLVKLAQDGQRATCRLQALSTLEGLAALEPERIEAALADAHAGVRRHAVRLAEPHMNDNEELAVAAARLVHDPDPQVRLQLACTLGLWDSPRAARALAKLAVRDRDDPFIMAAVMSSVTADNVEPLLAALIEPGGPTQEAAPALGQLLSIAAGYGRHAAVAARLYELTREPPDGYAPWQMEVLASLLDALQRKGTALAKLLESAGGNKEAIVHDLEKVTAQARQTATSVEQEEPARLSAVRLLSFSPAERPKSVATLASLLIPQTPGPLQSACVQALARLADKNTPALLLTGWKGHVPTLRAEILDVLLSRDVWLEELLAALESGAVLPVDIDAARRERLLRHRNMGLRTRAGAVLAGSINADRQQVIAEFRPALSLPADADRGGEVFTKRCANCHRPPQGEPVAPDLKGLTDKSPESLLVAILDPNRAVEPRYFSYLALGSDGRSYSGILDDETGSSITLVDQEGKRHVLLRSELEELASTGKSLMPEGLEKDLSPQDLADLMAYIAAGLPREER